MIVPIIMAIWFGYRARKTGKSVIGWAIGGAILSFVVATIFANAAILLLSGSLTGRIEFNIYITIRIVTGVLSIVAMFFIGTKILPIKPTDTSGFSAPETTEGINKPDKNYCTKCNYLAMDNTDGKCPKCGSSLTTIT